RFLALSLDAAGRPIPIVNTDPAMALLLDSLGTDRTLELVGPMLQPYPVGLFVDDLGPVVANDANAARDVWEAFRRDAYHSPTVVWGRDVNALLAGLARQLPPGDVGAQHAAPLQDALRRISDAVDRSGLRHAELWSYTIENGRLVPSRYGSSSDVQLWSLTDLAVQYLLNLHYPPPTSTNLHQPPYEQPPPVRPPRDRRVLPGVARDRLLGRAVREERERRLLPGQPGCRLVRGGGEPVRVEHRERASGRPRGHRGGERARGGPLRVARLPHPAAPGLVVHAVLSAQRRIHHARVSGAS